MKKTSARKLNEKMDKAIKSVKAQDFSALAFRCIEPVVLSALNLVKDLMKVTVSIIPAARVQHVASPSRR